jgi:hypothetical protein
LAWPKRSIAAAFFGSVSTFARRASRIVVRGGFGGAREWGCFKQLIIESSFKQN